MKARFWRWVYKIFGWLYALDAVSLAGTIYKLLRWSVGKHAEALDE